MKRLIKKSNLYHSFNKRDRYVEIFINPSFREIKDTYNSDEIHSLRGVICQDGSLIIWPGDILHDDINYDIKDGPKIDVDNIRFYYELGFWSFDANSKYSFEEIKQIIKNNSILFSLGSKSDDLLIQVTTEGWEPLEKLTVGDVLGGE